MKKQAGEFRRLERIIKGFANHYRLGILYLLHGEPGLTVEQVAKRLNTGYMNASDHLRKMTIAGLISKYNQGANVLHRLTPRALLVLGFCKKLK
ncbi:winged helix-turn-helix transcriptional regulator [Acetobacteraceae bacterium]|nr:winged helix-turn-helix transcriptional regulator [Candidatus Parcubacteria bacterium]